MNWLSYAIIALVTFSGYDLLSRHLGVQSKHPRAFGAVYYFTAALVTPILLVVEPIQIPSLSFLTIFLTACGLFVWILFGRLEYFVHKHVEASILTILIRLGPVITFVLSVFLLGESMTLGKVAGLVLTIAASVIVIGTPSIEMFRKQKGLSYGIALAIILGVAWTFDKVLSPIYGVVLFTTLSFLAPALSNALAPPIPWSTLQKELRMGSWKMVVLAFFNIIGYGAMMKALILGDATNVIPIATATPPLVVLGGVIFLKERTDIGKKALATLLVVLAIYLMR